MIDKGTVQKYPLFMHINFLYNSKFDFTAKSLVTNTVVITMVLRTNFLRDISLNEKGVDLTTLCDITRKVVSLCPGMSSVCSP